MSILDAIIQGVVQGLTEFLPVSSSGHLAITQHILGAVTMRTGLAESWSARSLSFISVPGIGRKSKNSGIRPMMSITTRLRL